MSKFFAFLILVWAGGFIWFVVALPQPLDGPQGEAAIVPTGGAGRIDRGLELLNDGAVDAVLISGVDREVRKEEFIEAFDVPKQSVECCITLGYAAVDTRTNATEAADWTVDRGYSSVRLVTTDWHMRRAENELRRVLPDEVEIYQDAVQSEPSLRVLFLEYHKYLASVLVGIFEVRQ